MDFFKVKVRMRNKGLEIYPDFQTRRHPDLMIRGGHFYAIWDEEANMWLTDEYEAVRLVDKELWNYYEQVKSEGSYKVMSMADFSTKTWVDFQRYVTSIPDSFHPLDNELTFQNTEVKKSDYRSKRLGYSLSEGDWSAWRDLSETLYDEEELRKIEWSIGSIISGDSRDIQKFLVFYGAAGAGKSTILKVIEQLFDGYYITFDAKALTSSNNQFSTEAFRSNPLVAIQHDGDLSKIEDNTKLNSIVSHEKMLMNVKYESAFSGYAQCFLFMATNRPVKITDAKSGIIRRLIDVKPSGRRIPGKRYNKLMHDISFQLGAIAKHCLDVYKELGIHYYDDYMPVDMMFQTDHFYNYVEMNYDDFKRCNGLSLTRAYELYNKYCEDSNIDKKYRLVRYKFREELKNYFDTFEDVAYIDGKHVRSYYGGFKTEKFERAVLEKPNSESVENDNWLTLHEGPTLLDDILKDCPAQYANANETPCMPWDSVKTKLSDLDTSKLHYILVPENHIVIDFDLAVDGKKDLQSNLKAAASFPETYAETSKSGNGLHLHYIWDGDVNQLSRVYAPGIEIKVFTGKSSLRRKNVKHNDIPIATIGSGLPIKEVKKTVDLQIVNDEKHLRNCVEKALRKEIEPYSTRCCMDYIKHVTDEAYEAGMPFDILDMRNKVFRFALRSTNQRDYCVKLLDSIHWRSEALVQKIDDPKDRKLIFFDVEVYPNLFIVCWKVQGEGAAVHKEINPTPEWVEDFIKNRLVGFNNLRYDNLILYARYLGYTNHQLFELSTSIIAGRRADFYRIAKDISYTDVYDFVTKKQSLKKYEIELDIHHQEMGIRWDQPVPEEYWNKVAEYCANDVIATEAVFNARQADWNARQIVAVLSGLTVNDTTNSHSGAFIFQGDKRPQSQFNYRFMGDTTGARCYTMANLDVDPEYTLFDDRHRPVFPGYVYDRGKSTYRGIEVGEGGRVYAEPGVYYNVALLDIASMHPSSIVAENLFGDLYTKRFKEIMDVRIAIKHGEFDKVRHMFDGKLAPYLEDEASAKNLANALKIVINSVYGLTSAKFDNLFRDPRNIDNIVAKRGALFMINLQFEVQRRGFTVAHIKTDSIKIPNATPEIIEFVMAYGREYGYNFEHEATYDRMCLVNDAVYIAKYKDGPHAGEWTATGAQFQQPFVFKTLFSHEPIEFKDLCETKSVSTALYLDKNEGLPDVSAFENELDRRTYNHQHPDKPKRLNPDFGQLSDDDIRESIKSGHRYEFVGKVGLFCPVKPGTGGGYLLREKDGKFASATGAKDYRWREAEEVKSFGLETTVDERYGRSLVDAAVMDISKYGDFEAFVN